MVISKAAIKETKADTAKCDDLTSVTETDSDRLKTRVLF